MMKKRGVEPSLFTGWAWRFGEKNCSMWCLNAHTLIHMTMMKKRGVEPSPRSIMSTIPSLGLSPFLAPPSPKCLRRHSLTFSTNVHQLGFLFITWKKAPFHVKNTLPFLGPSTKCLRRHSLTFSTNFEQWLLSW